MNRDDIIRMAQEAGFEIEKTLYGPVPCVDGRGIDDRLERFAALVAAAEREACATVCDEVECGSSMMIEERQTANECARKIRARGQS